MQYQRIFWLDDNPNFLVEILKQCSEKGYDRDSLLSRITMSYDYETGERIIQGDLFDLYILDGDFPNLLSVERKAYVDDFIAKVTHQTKSHDFKFLDGLSDGSVVACNFVNFYLNILRNREAKTIILSLSSRASLYAFNLSLPFYGKYLRGREEIKKEVMSREYWQHEDIKRRFSSDINVHDLLREVETWECGNMDELVERYLLK